MFKTVFKFLLVVVLVVACFFPCLVTVKAQGYYMTISADNAECYEVSVYSAYYATTTNYSSFPATVPLSPYGYDYLTITVVAESGYTYSYALNGGTSFLSNPFSSNFFTDSTLFIYFISTPSPTPTPTAGPTATPAPGTYRYVFYGLYDEDDQASLLGNVTVQAYYPSGSSGITGQPVEVFTILGGSYVYSPPNQPLYFRYDLTAFYGENVTREYWLSSDEVDENLYVLASPSGLSTVVFNVRALGGVSLADKFLVARSIYSDVAIEKLPVDSLGNVVMSLKAYSLYALSIEGAGSVFSFGDVATSSSPITLTVSPLSFPSDIILQYKYVHLYASRPTDTEIRVDYEDTENGTVSVSYSLAFLNGTVAYSNVETVDSFTDIWGNSSASESYYLNAIVVHSEFGTMTFQQVLSGSAGAVAPIDFSIFGSWGGVDATQILGALIVLIVFGVFSAYNAYVGIFAGVVTAIIMVWIGWLSSVSQGAIVAAFALAILLAITFWKRRGG